MGIVGKMQVGQRLRAYVMQINVRMEMVMNVRQRFVEGGSRVLLDDNHKRGRTNVAIYDHTQ